MAVSLLDPADEALLNEAAQYELTDSHTYRHFARVMQAMGWTGAQKFFERETSEEIEHFERHAQFMSDMGAVVASPALSSVASQISTLEDALQVTYVIEEALTRKYEAWYRASSSEMVRQHLLWFLDVQVKGTGHLADVLARVERAEGNTAALLMIDQELGA